MARVLLLSGAASAERKPAPAVAALDMLGHHVHTLPLEPAALIAAPEVDVVVIDARRDLPAARSLARLLRTTGTSAAVLAVLTQGELAAVTADWGLDDIFIDSADPAEVETRIRLAAGRQPAAPTERAPTEIRSGELAVDETTYTVRLRGQVVDVTFKEFELLKFLAQHPGRVFNRTQLLQEVWGYDYYGGTRTVDVHVRRLRAKLGPEYEQLIGTVRNVGYKFVSPPLVPLPEEVPSAIPQAPVRMPS
ncbi:MAG: winged helix-turn-helix transcriptional regulator [Mycobacteriales bacterium]